MQKMAKLSLVIFLITSIVFIPFGMSALAGSSNANDDITAGAMAADVLFVRPLGIVSVVVCAAVYIVALPFAAMGGNVNEVTQQMIVKPVKFTFKRPIGDF